MKPQPPTKRPARASGSALRPAGRPHPAARRHAGPEPSAKPQARTSEPAAAPTPAQSAPATAGGEGDLSGRASRWAAQTLGQTFLLSLLLFGLMIAFVLVSPDLKPAWSWTVKEEPLHKNAVFALREGEVLRYALTSGTESADFRLEVRRRSGCPGLLLVDTLAETAQARRQDDRPPLPPEAYQVCVNAAGNQVDAQGRPLGSNASFANLTWPYFQPWMLALHEDFDWGAELSFNVQPGDAVARGRVRYRVLNTTEYQGRPAFVVGVETRGDGSAAGLVQEGTALPAILVVDRERRVLLEGQSGGAGARLVAAPFLGKP